MRLRLILLVLSLLAVLSASIGGYLYYSAIYEAAFNEAERQAKMRLETLSKSITSFLLENTKVVRVLAGMEVLGLALTHPDRLVLERTNAVLDHFNQALESDVCYLMLPIALSAKIFRSGHISRMPYADGLPFISPWALLPENGAFITATRFMPTQVRTPSGSW